jgi:putative ABC transport system permease protein
VATYARSLGFAEILVPRALVEEHVTHPLDDLVFVKEDAGADEGALVAGLRKLQRADPALEIDTRSTYESRLEDAAQRRSFEVYILLGLILVFCGLAVVNAVTMSTAERAGEFALLRLVGADRRQVRTMIRAETMITLVFGLTIGTIIAIPGLAVLDHDLTGSFAPSGQLWLYAGLLVFFTLLGFAATVVPTRLALRLNPVKAMAAPK